MAKKIASSRPTRAGSLSATPFKAARKAPPKKVAVKVSKKAVAKKKLPQTLDWGKKVPKDHLSYLSKEEMKVLQKNRSFKGKRSFKGIPAFPDPGTTGYGDRGQGTKSSTGTTSKSGNTSGVGGGGGGGGGGASGSRGSSSGSVGAGNGANAGPGQGGQRGGYNSGTSGSRNGGASTQSPGMGRNEGRVGPQSPMSGQGTSFATNKAARDDTLRRAYGIEDQRGLQNMPQRPYFDSKLERTVNPNLPPVDREKYFKDQRAYEDRVNREQAALKAGRYRNPREIRSMSDDLEDVYDAQDAKAKVDRENLQKSAPLSQGNFRVNVSRGAASDRLPDIKLGGPRSGTKGGYSGGGMGGTFKGGGWGDGTYSGGQGGKGWKAGGLVKKNSKKSFKNK